MVEITLDVINKLGLHARAASKLTTLSARFSAAIELQKDGQTANAKSIMAVMLLAASQGTQLVLRCEGSDEQQAADAIRALFADRFGEGE